MAMTEKMQQKIVQLSLDLYRKELPDKYSERKADEVLREAWRMATGTDKFDHTVFRRHKTAIFEIIEETLTKLVNEGLTNQFSKFADVRNLNWGDAASFIIPDPSLFQVATISQSNGNLRRQRLDAQKIDVTTVPRGVKIYEDFYRFLVGRISWIDMVDRVRQSIEQSVANDVYSAIYNSFSSLQAPFKYTCTGTDGFSDATNGATNRNEFDKLVAHVEAAANAKATLYGTRLSLAKITPAVISNNLADRRNELGYFGVYNGNEMVEIRQAHKPGTTQFAIADDFVLVVPQIGGEKIVKVVNEGKAQIIDAFAQAPMNADMGMEFIFIMYVGIAVVAPFYYGIYKWA